MSTTTRLTLASGVAVALASSALLPLYDGQAWVLRVLGAVLVVVLAGLASRAAGIPRVLQPLVGLAVAAYYLCQVFASRALTGGLVPTGRTVTALRLLVEQGRHDIARYGPPVPTRTGLVLLTAAGVAGIALLVDLTAVVLDRAAVAGLPLLLLFAVPSAVLPGGLGWLPFGLGAAGWLGLLLVEGDDRVGRWGAPLRETSPGARPGGDHAGLGRVGRRIGAAAVGLAVVVPGLLPGLDGRLVGGNGNGGGPEGTGGTVSTTYDPIAQLQDELNLPTPRQLLVYSTSDPNPDYLRMTTLDSYTGAGWTYTRFEADTNGARVQNGIDQAPGDTATSRQRATTRIGIDSLDVRWLPSPLGPTKVAVDGRWLWDSGTQTIFSATRSTSGLPAYTVTSSRVLADRAALEASAADPVDPTVSRRYGQPLEVTPYVAALTRSVVKGAATPYDRAVALQAWFRSGLFRYDLRASRPTAAVPDALEAFLKGRQGFCEQYATAMAVMLRIAGLPSRVAVGFTSGTRTSTGGTSTKGTYSVTTSDAHAWPEAWFPGQGWVRFEPTPAQSRSTVPGYTQVPATAPGGTTAPTPTASTPVPRGGPATGAKDPEKLLGKQRSVTAPGTTTARGGGLPVWVTATVAGLVLAALPYLLTAVRRRRRLRHLSPTAAWEQLTDDAADVGHRWQARESPRLGAERLAAERRLAGPEREALGRLSEAAERDRYARPGTLSTAATSALLADGAVLRRALQRGAPRRVRLQARLLAPSTLRWAGSGLGSFVADGLDRLDEFGAATARRLRRA